MERKEDNFSFGPWGFFCSSGKVHSGKNVKIEFPTTVLLLFLGENENRFFLKKMETIEFFSTSLSPEIQVLIERFFPPSPQNGTRFGQTMGWLGKRKLSRRREKFPLVVYIYAFQSISIFHKESPW